MTNQVYTQSDFARRIGKTKQWVSDKIKRHVAMLGYEGTIVFYSVQGEELRVRLMRSEGSQKWLLTLLN